LHCENVETLNQTSRVYLYRHMREVHIRIGKQWFCCDRLFLKQLKWRQ